MSGTTKFGIIQSKLPENRTANIWVTHEFIAAGISFLQDAEQKSSSINQSDPQAAVKYLGKASVGMTCLAHGFELLLDTIVQAENIDIPKKSGQHALVVKFREICKKHPNFEQMANVFFSNCNNPVSCSNADALLNALEKSYFPARYFGIGDKRNSLSVVNSLAAGQLAVAIATTFPMLKPIELAKSIGFNVS